MEIRRLSLQDLDAIVGIENAVYPTPWSRSMFAGELAKPSSFSLGAFDPDAGGLVAYLIVSRYVDAWHIMNVAVHPEYRRQGVASRRLDELFELTGGVQLALNSDANWRPFKIEGYIFITLIYFAFCFAMSRYGLWVEKQVSVSKTR